MNFKKSLLLVSGMSSVLISAGSFAQDEPGYEASLSLGYVGTTGNVETETFNTEFLISFASSDWLHNAKFQALGSTKNKTATAERYYIEDKSDYNLDDMQYLFIKASYNDDRFSGFDYQAAVAAGYGRYLMKQDNFSFQAFGGIGYRINEISNGIKENETILSLGESLKWKLSDTSTITHSLTSEIGDELTITRAEIGLVSNIIDRIATKIAFQVKNTSKVPLGAKETDTQTSISLVYSF